MLGLHLVATTVASGEFALQRKPRQTNIGLAGIGRSVSFPQDIRADPSTLGSISLSSGHAPVGSNEPNDDTPPTELSYHTELHPIRFMRERLCAVCNDPSLSSKRNMKGEENLQKLKDQWKTLIAKRELWNKEELLKELLCD